MNNWEFLFSQFAIEMSIFNNVSTVKKQKQNKQDIFCELKNYYCNSITITVYNNYLIFL